jgi:hypothetical protein
VGSCPSIEVMVPTKGDQVGAITRGSLSHHGKLSDMVKGEDAFACT